MKAKIIVVLAAGLVLSADSAVVRKLPSVTVVENETIATDSMKATAVRTSNPAVFGVALRET